MRSADATTSTVSWRTATAGWGLPAAATLAVLAVASTGIEPRALPALYLAVVSPALAAIDVREHRLPNRLVLPGFAVGLVGAAGQWAVSGVFPLVALIAGAGYGAALLLLAVLGGMGMGDVKLAGVLGLSAGLVSVDAAVVAPVTAFLIGGVGAVAALRGGRRAGIPFGPYLLAGYWIALVISRGASST
ncbi:prepilin peptidase [Salinibacterium soli]|uniref:A24 family peptidase n=1 Tax=Antiquaquibacter soli TaxID=3064523 RepID=A0ABT9BJR9_9MICO|nr:A24 family peptidase [Protaetiibacter sp. WY-16]MDO7881269.1 A24 family peptidase [Protaetiibacter sp. WY-16]